MESLGGEVLVKSLDLAGQSVAKLQAKEKRITKNFFVASASVVARKSDHEHATHWPNERTDSTRLADDRRLGLPFNKG